MSLVTKSSNVQNAQLTPKGNFLTPREIVLIRNAGIRILTAIGINVKECVRPVLSWSWREHVGMCEGS